MGLPSQAQNKEQEPAYINYNSYMNVIAGFVRSADTLSWHNAMQSLVNSAQSLKEETPVQLPLENKHRDTRPLSDEALYAKRKGSVVVIGRLRRTSGANLNFEMMGTGFLLSGEGHCLTNYHVMQHLFQAPLPEEEVVYLVITEDRKAYMINEVFTYSRNNDLVVFSVDGKARHFDPIPLGKPSRIGSPVYCISHPAGELYYYSKGMVNRNVVKDSLTLQAGSVGVPYNSAGNTPIRMEISADFGAGSSGGPIMDQYGNLVGMVCTTSTISITVAQAGGQTTNPQMVIRSAIPLKAITELVRPSGSGNQDAGAAN